MALPTSNITTTIVKNEIGESSNSVSVLRKSPKVNYWGFSSTLRGWGRSRSLAAPYDLGDFRGYDHYWKCWSMDGIVNTSTSYEDGCRFALDLFSFPSWAVDDNTDHDFSIEVKRTNDYQHGDGMFVSTFTIFNNQYTKSFWFSPYDLDSFDGQGDLVAGSTVYIRVTHLGSDIRRWDSDENLAIESNDDEFIFPFVVPESVTVTPTVTIQATSAAGWYLTDSKGVSGNIEIKANDYTTTDATISWLIEFNTADDFSLNGCTVSGSVTTTPDGVSYGSESNFSIPGSFSLGTTIYYRARLTNLGGAGGSTSWNGVKSFVMDDLAPIE
ncbi:hypothetical protein E9993_01595 [Labilibacter sediminis]|nr:hypothetical protein E9993_01595 [Labilibacter sediminis]